MFRAYISMAARRSDAGRGRRLALLCLLPFLGGLALLSAVPGAAQRYHAVERVVDGDTVIVAGIGRVRLLGVDTPESVHPTVAPEFHGREAALWLRRTLSGRRVRLSYDGARTGRYGRTLAYLHLPDGTFVNEELIRLGHGRVYRERPFRYRQRFDRLEVQARQARRGMWRRGGSVERLRRGQRGSGGRMPASVSRYDDNGNGRLSCSEARRHGIVPVRRGHPAYPFMRDADGDGVVCE